jgi:hypothetical protein
VAIAAVWYTALSLIARGATNKTAKLISASFYTLIHLSLTPYAGVK